MISLNLQAKPVFHWQGEDPTGTPIRFRCGYDINNDFQLEIEAEGETSDLWRGLTGKTTEWKSVEDSELRWAIEGLLKDLFDKSAEASK